MGENKNMTVAQLIEQLKKQPQDAIVQAVNYDGCVECNPEGFSQYREVDRVFFQERLDYPSHEDTNMVVLE
jgi:hypothetical protein